MVFEQGEMVFECSLRPETLTAKRIMTRFPSEIQVNKEFSEKDGCVKRDDADLGPATRRVTAKLIFKTGFEKKKSLIDRKRYTSGGRD